MVPHATHPVGVGGWGAWDKGPGSRERQRKVKLKDCRSVLQDHVLALDTKSYLQPSSCQTSIYLPIREPGNLQEQELLALGQRGL